MPVKRSRRKSSPAPTRSPWVKRARSGIHGRGLCARKRIPAGTRVIEYVGERITKREADRREELRLRRQRNGGDGNVFTFEVTSRHDIDGRVSWNTARLINHSCNPNCESDVARGRVWIVALRDIEDGEELTYDYGYGWEGWEEHPCRCGDDNCVGYIISHELRPRLRALLTRRRRARK